MAQRPISQDDLRQAVAEVLASVLQSSSAGAMAASNPSPPNWVDDILKALDPLKALSPAHGEIPAAEANRMSIIQDALRRADLSKAVRPAAPGRSYLQIMILGTETKR